LGIKDRVEVTDRDFLSFSCTVSGPGYGFVYVMSYPGSDKVKIGHTLDPDTRAGTIGGTLAPEDPVLQAYYWCSENREAVERQAHARAKEYRQKGEWFLISVKDAMNAIELAGVELKIELKLVFEASPRRRTAFEEQYIWVPSEGAYVRRNKAK
jgi:hypothetical protein